MKPEHGTEKYEIRAACDKGYTNLYLPTVFNYYRHGVQIVPGDVVLGPVLVKVSIRTDSIERTIKTNNIPDVSFEDKRFFDCGLGVIGIRRCWREVMAGQF